jgi:DNA polymerase-2
MNAPRKLDAFLLSREWRDRDDGIEITLWAHAEQGPVRARFPGQEAVMFVPRGVQTRAARQRERPLSTLHGAPVDAAYFPSQRSMIAERERLRGAASPTFESDVKPADRFLMERFVTASMTFEGPGVVRDGVLHLDRPQVRTADYRPRLSLLALDLETDGWDGPLLSAAVATAEHGRVFVRGAGRDDGRVTFVADEAALLRALFAEIASIDPDVICGWNVVDFDLAVLQARCLAHRLPFALGRASEASRVLDGSSAQPMAVARVPGRVVLDGIATLKSATLHFERFTLEAVSQQLLGRGKKIAADGDPLAEIRRMHASDPLALAAYNLEDCRLVLDIFAKVDLLGFAMERARLTGLPMDRPGGSVAAFDHLYLPRLHRRGFVAPDVGVASGPTASPGGHVLDSVPGLFGSVLSFDFRSLYPSIIRTFQIDPLGLWQPGDDPVPGFEGATFARHGAILPELLETLHEARSEAMAGGHEALSRAIKIVMNSFYGVLGTPGCRFFDARLPTSITRRGHAMIERARVFFEAQGLPVLYGDTDSLFVRPARDLGDEEAAALGRDLASTLTRTLADEIAREFRVESRLELRFESHYLRFLMPTMRAGDRGSKKRYAGLVRKADGSTSVVVKGLEAVRTDWTPLARRVQLELLRRVFADEPFEAWLVGLARDLVAGRLDAELVYRKRLRHELGDYAQEGAPPHVQAARLLGRGSLREIEYVVTTQGPEPVEKRSAPIDHVHYRDAQVAPACDVVLACLGTSFEVVAGAQRSLF